MEYRFDARGPEASTGVVVLRGRLDLRAAGDLKVRIQHLVGDGFSHLVVDLREVAYIDSSGLSALIGAVSATRSAGGDCRIACPVDEVRYVLAASTLDRVLTPYSTVEAALAEYL